MTCAFFHVYFFNFFPLPNFNRACLCFFWFSRSFQAPIINLLKRYKGFISFFIWVRQLSCLLILLIGKQKYNFKLNFTEISILYTRLHLACKAGVKAGRIFPCKWWYLCSPAILHIKNERVGKSQKMISFDLLE